MEALAFTEGPNPHNDPQTARNYRITLCLAACMVILMLVLLPFFIACMLLHHKQSPKTCCFHGSSPVPSDETIQWEWEPSCPGSALTASGSSLEVLESGMYFVYAYVALKEEASTDHHFTVHLIADSQVLSVFQGSNVMRAFINMGRPYFLENGKKLHLEINEGLTHIDSNRTYWGILKI
ncbi:tumor necrosis factor ligand superfamily member 18-like [Zootoca vivipara]|uniref:tumor necrosis factor ligand superfamily member 18-like n=1 Tax=Zootoca vivipara TaxID=8524 RepID=UPI0015925370|nr:tumor necrosis factor ligand superfamily member 18-like [Zootoca vivipara]